MNILHLLSQTHLTGAEVYATQLIKKQQIKHQCFIVSDTLHSQTEAKYYSQSIDKRDVVNRIKNLWFLYFFCKSNQINIIHSHSRASSWLAYFIGKWLKIKIVSTVHGRQGIHASSKRKNIYGENIIAVCGDIKQHLVMDLNIPEKFITVIHNGFDLTLNKKNKPIKEIKKIAWVGRLTGPKGDVIKQLVDKVFCHFPNIKFDCFGGPDEYLDKYNKNIPKNVKFLGQFDNVLSEFKNYQIIFGSGRVAIEAMFANNIVYGIGEITNIGFINSNNIKNARWNNFGDCGAKQSFDFDKIVTDLQVFLKTPQVYDYQEILKPYQLETVFQEVMQIYA
jgi:glycosyltransferase involved in cell wall biosynthesis